MRTNGIIIFLLIVFISACHSEIDQMDGRNPVMDTFILVDYYSGVYKFVQIENEYTIGVVEGLIEVPDDFTKFQNEEISPYYKVNLILTGFDPAEGVVQYQRFTGTSNSYLIKQAGDYQQVSCSVLRVEFFNDYLYYLSY